MNKEEWKKVRLGEVCEVICGRDYKHVRKENGEYPIYGSGGIMGYASDYRCPEYCTIIGRKGSINNPIYVETKFWNVDTAFGLNSDKEKLNPKYLYYFCKEFDFNKLNVAVTLPSLRRTDVLEISLPLPPLSVQREIVSELDLLSTILTKKRAQLAELDRLAAATFHQTFGDPIENPKQWPIKKLGEVCKINPPKKEVCLNENDKISFLPMEDLNINAYKITPEQSRKYKEVWKSSYTYFADGDVIVAKVTPCFENGKIGIAYNLNNGVGFGTSELNVFRPDVSLISEYLYFCLSTEDFREQGHNHLSGASGLRRLTKDFILNYKIILPPLSLQQTFASKISSIEKQKELIKKSVAAVQTLLDATMDKYFG